MAKDLWPFSIGFVLALFEAPSRLKGGSAGRQRSGPAGLSRPFPVGQDSNPVVVRILNDTIGIVSQDPAQADLWHGLATLPSIVATRLHRALVLRHRASTIRPRGIPDPPTDMRHPPDGGRHPPDGICHLPPAIRHLPFVICHLPFGRSGFAAGWGERAGWLRRMEGI